MLVLSRRAGEVIHIGKDIVIRIVEIRHNRIVRLGFEAPTDVVILRGELTEKEQTKEEGAA